MSKVGASRHRDHGHRHGGDNNLRSAYIHVVADALTSVSAIAALLAGRYLGWIWMDPVMGIVGAIIARWSWSPMRDIAAVRLDRSDHHIADEGRTLVEAPGDARIADLHVWRVGPDANAAIVGVTGAAGLTGNIIRDRLRCVHEVKHLTIEVVRA